LTGANQEMAAGIAADRAIGYVPQDTFLFTETVGENIAFGTNN